MNQLYSTATNSLGTSWPLPGADQTKLPRRRSVPCGCQMCAFSNQLWGQKSLSANCRTQWPWVTLWVTICGQSRKCCSHPNLLSAVCQATIYCRHMAADVNLVVGFKRWRKLWFFSLNLDSDFQINTSFEKSCLIFTERLILTKKTSGQDVSLGINIRPCCTLVDLETSSCL